MTESIIGGGIAVVLGVIVLIYTYWIEYPNKDERVKYTMSFSSSFNIGAFLIIVGLLVILFELIA